MMFLMKQGDFSAQALQQIDRQLTELLADINVEQLSIGAAREAVLAASALEDRISFFKTRCATQLAKQRIKSQPPSENKERQDKAAQRGIENLFTEQGHSSQDAKRQAQRSETLRKLPLLERHLDSISSSNFDSIARHISRLDSDQLALLDQQLIVNKATTMAPDMFEKTLRRHIDQATTEPLADHHQKRAASTVKHWFNSTTGMGHIHAELDPERYERIANRIDREVTRLANKRKERDSSASNATKDPYLAADAYCNLFSNNSGPDTSLRPGTSADMIVIVDKQTLTHGRHTHTIAETEAGAPLPDETVARLACDATITVVNTDGPGRVLNVGRKSRTATDAQWTAIKAMHSTCAWHNCETRIQHCQLHHIKYWRNGGETNLDNLVPLCSQHHHQTHEGGWTLQLNKDRELTIINPDKTVWRQTKPPNRIEIS